MKSARTIVIVDDWASVERALQDTSISQAASNETLSWATQSPFVQERLAKKSQPVIALDAEITQGEADRIGYEALSVTADISRKLDQVSQDTEEGLALGMPLRNFTHRLLTAIFYKGVLFDNLLSRTEPNSTIVAVGRSSLSETKGFNPMLNRFDTLFAVFADRLGLSVIDFEAPIPAPTFETGDYLTPTTWSRISTLLNAPWFMLPSRIWQSVYRGRPIRLPWKRCKGTVLIHGSNELISEVWWSLFLRGMRVSVAPSFTVSAAHANVTAKMPASQSDKTSLGKDPNNRRPLEEPWNAIETDVLRSASACEIRDDRIIAAAASLFIERLSHVFVAGSATVRAAIDYATKLRATQREPVAFLSNGLANGDNCVLRSALERAGIHCFVAEHGVAPGLSDLHDAVMRHERKEALTNTLFWTPIQFRHANSHAGITENEACVTGLPTQIRRIGLRRLQRAVVRREYKVERRMICWCTGLYPNNFQFLPHYWRDTPYHNVRKDIIFDVLAKIDATVLLKLYPTFRYKDPDPFVGEIALPSNFRVEQFKDFRALRAAVDILIIDGPGSVLAWGWCAEIPFVFIETGMYTLRDEVRELFRAATFYVDTRDPDWRETLIGILSMSDRDLMTAFHAMLPARKRLAAECLLGHDEGAGRTGAAFIERRMMPPIGA